MPVPHMLSQHYGDADKYFAEHSLERKTAAYCDVLRSIERLILKKGRILDVGTGRGEMLKAANSCGWQAVGLEPSSDFARFAREYSGAEIFEARLEDQVFSDGSFDVVTLGAVLEHLFNPVDVLTEINRILRQGGLLWLDVPNEAGAYFRLGNAYHRIRGRDWVVNLSPTFPPYHVFGYGPRSVRSLANRTGFDVAEFKTYATSAVIKTSQSPVPPLMQPIISGLLRISEMMGAGTYMDVWAVKR